MIVFARKTLRKNGKVIVGIWLSLRENFGIGTLVCYRMSHVTTVDSKPTPPRHGSISFCPIPPGGAEGS